MSVLSYLTDRASGAILSESEKASIITSIATLSTRLYSHFGNKVSSHFQFGSSTRGTILPRKMDENSDIDYMVVFAEAGFTPQTYLDRLKSFVSTYYSTSEIYQSSPTIVLNLNHIKFELVPALADWGGYKIPNGTANWQSTNPNDTNKALEDANKANSYMIKPAIRLVKFWNAKSGYVFDSFPLEKWIFQKSYWGCSNQKDYFYAAMESLAIASDAAQWRKDALQRAKDIIIKTKNFETDNMPYSAEAEIKKIIPE
jgi:predicted nucleotidyltransferase